MKPGAGDLKGIQGEVNHTPEAEVGGVSQDLASKLLVGIVARLVMLKEIAKTQRRQKMMLQML